MDVGYAVSHGIIDQANGQYVGLDMNGKEQRIPISEAIKKGILKRVSRIFVNWRYTWDCYVVAVSAYVRFTLFQRDCRFDIC